MDGLSTFAIYKKSFIDIVDGDIQMQYHIYKEIAITKEVETKETK